MLPISALLILACPLLPITHRSLRLNSRDRIVSQATSVHNRPERMAPGRWCIGTLTP